MAVDSYFQHARDNSCTAAVHLHRPPHSKHNVTVGSIVHRWDSDCREPDSDEDSDSDSDSERHAEATRTPGSAERNRNRERERMWIQERQHK